MDSIYNEVEGSNMIEFNVISDQKAIKRIPQKYPKLTEFEADFKIIVNGRVFFHEPNFPLLEFLHFVNEWVSQGANSLEYSSIETEDNPLISFISEDDMWMIRSPWQLFECEIKFTKKEIINALDVLKKSIHIE